MLAPIGAGSSAQVFLADDVALRRRVAVKVLHPGLAADEGFLRRFRLEAQATAALNHPNAVAVFDWGEDDTPFLVTEFCGGGSLRAILDHNGPLSAAQALVVGLEAARGLDYAHNQGFVHRDIKPANLLFGDDRRLRIADFGLARALAEAAHTEPEGAVVGSARYVSPEQAESAALDGRSDVYSLAVVLVEAVSGEVPFTAETTMATLRARTEKPLPIPKELGPLRGVLQAAGAIDPVDRFTAAELGAALMETAASFDRPEPIPLVPSPVIAYDRGEHLDPTWHEGDVEAADGDDITTIAPLPEGSANGSNGHRTGGDGTGRAGGAAALDPGDLDAADLDPDLDVDADPDDDLARPSRRRRRQRSRRRRLTAAVMAFVVALAVAAAAVLLGDAFGVGDLATGSSSEPETATVLDYTGRTVEQVEAEIDNAGHGWDVVVVDELDDDVAEGRIIRQEPPDGTELAEGERLFLFRSGGMEREFVPGWLVGRSREQVEAWLVDNELEARFEDGPSEDVAPGAVAALDPVQQTVEHGSIVTVTISTGPPLRTIPEPTSDPAELQALLTEMGLQVATAEESSQTVPEGEVIRTEPAAGAEVERDSAITIVVSTGLPYLEIPNVIGQSGVDATLALEERGFVVPDIEGNPLREVIATDPAAGEYHRQGAEVYVITART